MKRMTGKSAAFLLTCLLLLLSFSVRVMACTPSCPDCYFWFSLEQRCAKYGDCWEGCSGCEECVDCYCECNSECNCDVNCTECCGCCDCSGCSCVDNDSKCEQADCRHCVDCHCESKCTPYTETCCNGTCCDVGKCCNYEICCGASERCCTDSGSYCCPDSKTCCGGNCCDPEKCESCVGGSCVVLNENCPSASGGCLAGGACGVGNFHKEWQNLSSYPMCISGAPCNKLYTCIVLLAFSNEDCTIQLLIYCPEEYYGCDPGSPI